MHGKPTGELTCVVITKRISAGNNDRTGLPSVTSTRQTLTLKGDIAPMSATENVRQLPQSHNSVPRHGVLTLVGYGIQVRVDKGHLFIQDGIGADRYNYRLPRAGHQLK